MISSLSDALYKSSMKADFINPFLNAAMNVVGTMAATKAVPGIPSLKRETNTWGLVNGIIGLASNEHLGNMILSFEESCILFIVNKMLSESYSAIDKNVIDAVGELTNMISGGAKKELRDLGFLFEMALPVVITGKNVQIHQLIEGPTIIIPFTTQAGAFRIEANLVERKK